MDNKFEFSIKENRMRQFPYDTENNLALNQRLILACQYDQHIIFLIIRPISRQTDKITRDKNHQRGTKTYQLSY